MSALLFEKCSTDILSFLSGLELLSQGKSVSSILLKHFLPYRASWMEKKQPMNSAPRTSLCPSSGSLPSAGFAVFFHFSSLRSGPGPHVATDRQVSASVPSPCFMLFLADQIGQ